VVRRVAGTRRAEAKATNATVSASISYNVRTGGAWCRGGWRTGAVLRRGGRVLGRPDRRR
jgi:hypothetical protein